MFLLHITLLDSDWITQRWSTADLTRWFECERRVEHNARTRMEESHGSRQRSQR